MKNISIVILLFSVCILQGNKVSAQDDSNLQVIKNEERSIVDDILATGIGDRLTIPGIITSKADPSAITIRSEGKSFVASNELPSDGIPTYFSFTKNPLSPDFEGNESIHRFYGNIVNWVKYIEEFPEIIGTGDIENRLTFLLLKDIGYVYVRGEGKLVYPDGTTIELPGN